MFISKKIVSTIIASTITFTFVACTNNNTDELSQTLTQNTNNKDYLSADGTVTTLLAENRKPPLQLQATTYDNVDINLQQNTVTVINFWYSACGPCRAEAKDLENLHQEFLDKNVTFLGVNTRDEAQTAAAFQRTFGITYTTIDGRNGKILAEMKDQIPQQAVPTTVVLDKQGRVYAKILGAVDPNVLRTIINETLAEQQ